MAAITPKANIIISSTDGDTFVGPLVVSAIKTVSTATGTHFQIKDGSTVIWESWPGAAGTQEFNQFGDGWPLASGATFTIKIPAGSGTLYIYLE